MSTQVLANSATKLSVSSPTEIDIMHLVEKNATKSVKGATRERLLLNGNKLMTIVCDEYRSLRGMEKGVRLDDELANNIQSVINEYITKTVNRIHPQNVVSFRRHARHDFRNQRIVDRLTAIGEDTMTLKDQRFMCIVLIEQREKLLKDYRAKKTPDLDREKAIEEEIRKLNVTKHHIEATIADIEKTKKP